MFPRFLCRKVPKTGRPRLKGIAEKLMLALVSTGIVLLAGELLARRQNRAFWRPPAFAEITPSNKEFSSYIAVGRPFFHTNKPNARYVQFDTDYKVKYEINSWGYRGPDFSSRPPRGWKRLLVVGDSMAEGHGVEADEAFPAVLARKLADERWEVINASAQGCSHLSYVASFPRYLAAHPDAVMVTVFDNDPVADYLRLSQAYLKHPIAPDASKVLLKRKRGFFQLALWDYAVRAVNGKPKDSEWEGWEELETACRQFGATEQGRSRLPLYAEQEGQYRRYEITPQEWERMWGASERLLDLLDGLFKRHDIPVYYVRLQYDFCTPASPPGVLRVSQYYTASFREWAERNHAVYTVLDSALSGGASGLTLPKDGHPNRQGQEMIAKLLYPWIKKTILPHRSS